MGQSLISASRPRLKRGFSALGFERLGFRGLGV